MEFYLLSSPVSLSFVLLRSKSFLLQIFYPDIPSVLPDPLKIVKEAVFLVKYMYNDIAEVEQHPARRGLSFSLLQPEAGLVEFFLYVVDERIHLAVAASVGYDKVVRQNRDPGDICRSKHDRRSSPSLLTGLPDPYQPSFL